MRIRTLRRLTPATAFFPPLQATAFPNGVSFGATFDAALLHDIGLAIGTEARGTHNTLADKSAETGGTQWPGTINNGGGLTLYAPNINLVRITSALRPRPTRELPNTQPRPRLISQARRAPRASCPTPNRVHA